MAIKAKLNNAVEWGKYRSPEILLVTGLIEGAVGVFLACRSTLKAKKILERSPKKETLNKEKLSKAIDIGLAYTPAAVLLTASGVSVCASHGIMKRRYTGLMAAYGTLTATFMEYRSRVRDEIGEEKEEALYYGTDKEVISVKIEQKDGKEKKVNKKFDVRKANGLSPYAGKFDPIMACETSNPYYIDSTLQRVETCANDQLMACGHLYLNDVRKELYLDRDDVGQLVGWLYDPHNYKEGARDNAVKIIKKEIFVKKDDGEYEKEIWLDFNVDGVIFGKMSQKEYRDTGICERGDQGLQFSNKEE